MKAMKNELDEQELEHEELDDDDELDDEQDDEEQDDEEQDDEQDEEELDEHVVVAGTPVMLAPVILTAGRFLNALTRYVNRSVMPEDESVGELPMNVSRFTGNAVTPVLDAGENT